MLTRQWLEPLSLPSPEALQTLAGEGLHPLVAQVLARRGLVDTAAVRAFLDPACFVPVSPFDLPGMEVAVARIESALRRQERIGVWGDFDVDGQTSTTLLVEALRRLGAEVRYHIPVRERESHGVTIPYLSQFLDDGVQLVVTCDTGITANEAVAYARQRGVDVVVTDHHSLPAQLPEALALVNSQFLPHGHPLGTLPGVGVAYKLVEALCQRRGEPDACAQYLDLVALGIVADVALQTGETRYLLQRGLSALRQTPRLGLQTLFEMAELNPVGLSEEHIGFVIGPRLNALGRLSDANPIIEFLTTRDASRARVLAVQLEGLNEQRKLLTDQVYQGALAQLQKEPKLLDAEALILAHPGWPGGVVGIVASRLVDRFHKPTILLTLSPDGSARGSARSIEGCDITACLTENQALLAGFGGHPMAAGLSLSATAIPELRRALSRSIQRALGDTGIISTLPIDGYVSLADVSLELVHHIERIAPFGPGNPALVLATRNLVAKHTRPVGRGGDHHLVTVEDESGNNQRVIWWNSRAEDVPDGHFDLAYTVRATTYKGQADVQVEWIDSRRLEALPTEIIAAPPAIEIVDYRLVASPQATLLELQREGELQIWSEAEDPPVGTERHRLELAASAALVIWTIPPGPDVLRNVLEVVQPRQVYLFGIQPATSQLEPFLKRLAGLAKYAINQQQGETHFSILAARTAQRERVVVLGLQWLEASGMLKVIRQEHDLVWLASSGGGKTARLPEIAQALKSALDETSAYRMYFLKADKTSLFAY